MCDDAKGSLVIHNHELALVFDGHTLKGGRQRDVGMHRFQLRHREHDILDARNRPPFVRHRLNLFDREQAVKVMILEHQHIVVSAGLDNLILPLVGYLLLRIYLGLTLAELEMRQGLSAEQALALVAEKSPEIAPAIATALSAKYGAGNGRKE